MSDRKHDRLSATGGGAAPPLPLQKPFVLSAPGDSLEHEARTISDEVMRGGRKRCSVTPVGSRPAGRDIPGPSVQANIEEVLRSSGQPLDAGLRDLMEPGFEHDFSRVRVHSDDAAEQSARAIGAEAYTVGNHVVFDSSRFAPGTDRGRRLLAHELTHTLQQSTASSLGADSLDTLCVQRDTPAPPAPAAGPKVGDAVQPDVEALLETFSKAPSYEAKNAAAMQAVNLVIRAYSMSTKGLKGMKYDPTPHPTTYADSREAEDKPRESTVTFYDMSFSKGFANLVHVVAHELEHVRQAVIGGVAYPRGQTPLREFLAYTAMILQVQNVAGPTDRGLLGAMASDRGAPSLPPLPPEILQNAAMSVLEWYYKMDAADQKKPQYRQELGAASNRLLERLKAEAPRPLKPPAKFTPEWQRWYDGEAPTLDIMTMEYQEWQDALKSPWNQVKAVWKRMDALFRV